MIENELIGDCRGIQQVREQIKRLRGQESTVLITGETGTGKDIVARSIHSGPKEKFKIAFIAGMSGHLVQSELFGHKKNSYTGAEVERVGLVEQAEGGTVFLDEFGEIDLDTQVQLLRFLQSREFHRVGDSGNERKANVRVVAATNRDLEKMIKEKSFREDLYYRVTQDLIELPPLRERDNDSVLLANHFAKSEYRGPRSLSPCAIEQIRKYHWPGNVRELQNVIERAKRDTSNAEIAATDLRLHLRNSRSASSQVEHHEPFGDLKDPKNKYSIKNKETSAALQIEVIDWLNSQIQEGVTRARLISKLGYGGNPTTTLKRVARNIKRRFPELSKVADTIFDEPSPPDAKAHHFNGADTSGVSTHFVGRETYLQVLHERFQESRERLVVQVLHGIPGVGKTRLAREYVNQFQDTFTFVWAISAQSNDSALADLTERCKQSKLIDDEQEEQNAVIHAAKSYLKEQSDWLLVFDNAETPDILHRILAGTMRGNVIVTSRSPNWRSYAQHVEPVSILSIQDSTRLLRRLTGDRDEENAARIVILLGRLPLAIHQAAGFIETVGITLADFYFRLQTWINDRHDQNEIGLDDVVPYDSSGGFIGTINLSTQFLKEVSETGYTIIQAMSLFAHDGISRTLFEANEGDFGFPAVAVDSAIAWLRNLALIESRGGDFSIHRLTSVCIRKGMGESKFHETVILAINLLTQYLRDRCPNSDDKIHALQHALSVCEHSHIVRQDRLVAKSLTQLLSIVSPVASAFWGFGDPSTERIYETMREITQQLGEPNFQVVFGLSVCQITQGKFNLARTNAKQCLQIATARNEARLILESHMLLGVPAYYIGNFRKAHVEFLEANRIATSDPAIATDVSFGQNPLVTNLCYLAQTHWHLGNREESIITINSALEAARRLSHPFTLTFALHFAAGIYQLADDAPKTGELSDEEFTIAKQHGFALFESAARIFHGWSVCIEQKDADGIEEMRGGLYDYAETGAVLGIPGYRGYIFADAYIALSMPEKALVEVDAALDHMNKTEEVFLESALLGKKGEALIALGDRTLARSVLERSIALADAKGAHWMKVKAQCSFAMLK